MKWFEADPRWSVYVASKEEYLEKFVVTGKFHNEVPKDVSDAFETVSYLMAHSYYHWPMYDEALNKALLTMEMAVKLKAKEMNLAPDYTTAKGKVIAKKLVEIIDEVLGNQHLSFLKNDFNRVREIRNFKVHPDSNVYLGGLGHAQANIIRLINLINFLFMNQTDLDTLTQGRDRVGQFIRNFKPDVYVLELPDKKILIESIISCKYVPSKNKGIYTLVISPVLINPYDSLTDKKYSKPIVLPISQLTIQTSGITGIDIDNNAVSIYPTDKAENHQKYHDYQSGLAKVAERDKVLYRMYSEDTAARETERLIYEHCW